MYLVNRHGFSGKWAFLKSSLDVANQIEEGAKERGKRERERNVGHFEHNNVFVPGAVTPCTFRKRG